MNVLNLVVVEHALSECIQLLIDFWREKVPRIKYQTLKYDSAARSGGYMQEKITNNCFEFVREITIQAYPFQLAADIPVVQTLSRFPIMV